MAFLDGMGGGGGGGVVVVVAGGGEVVVLLLIVGSASPSWDWELRAVLWRDCKRS